MPVLEVSYVCKECKGASCSLDITIEVGLGKSYRPPERCILATGKAHWHVEKMTFWKDADSAE